MQDFIVAKREEIAELCGGIVCVTLASSAQRSATTSTLNAAMWTSALSSTTMPSSATPLLLRAAGCTRGTLPTQGRYPQQPDDSQSLLPQCR